MGAEGRSVYHHHEAEAVGGVQGRGVARVVEQDALQRVDGGVGAARHRHVVIRPEARQPLLDPLLEHQMGVREAHHLNLGQRPALVGLIAEQEPLDVRIGDGQVDRPPLDVCQGARHLQHLLYHMVWIFHRAISFKIIGAKIRIIPHTAGIR